MRQEVSETLEVSHLELLRRASTHGDLRAWAAFQQSLEELLLTWLHKHPGREAACHLPSEQHVVAQAFERLRQATIQRQVNCETLSEVLVYLRASLNGVILEMLRDSKRQVQTRAFGLKRKTGTSSGIGYKRDFQIGKSSDWPIYFIAVDWNPRR